MKPYIEYDFVLVLRNVYEDTPDLEDALYEAGCDSALIKYRYGVVSLAFHEETDDLEKTIHACIQCIESSSVGAQVDHVEGSFVTLSEIALKSGFSRQAISLFIQGKRGKGMFPVPFAGIDSSSPIWRWSDVLQWLLDNDKIEKDNTLDEAQIIDRINLSLQCKRYGYDKKSSQKHV